MDRIAVAALAVFLAAWIAVFPGCRPANQRETREDIRLLHNRIAALEYQVDRLDAERMEREMAAFEVPPNGR